MLKEARRASDGALRCFRDERLLTIKASTLKRQLNPLRHMFEIARDEWGMPVERNPVKKLKLDAQDQRRERRLREGEFDRLIEAAKSRRNPLIGSIIRFAVATGMRRGEILGVRWKHVDRAQRSLLIPDTKTGQSRTIPLIASALEVLAERRRDDERVFPITANAFRLAWERVKFNAGIEDLHFHDLRHEAISLFFEKGLSTPEVALISGHKDLRMLFRYAHAARQAILAKLEGQAGIEQKALKGSLRHPQIWNEKQPNRDIGSGSTQNLSCTLAQDGD
ncbi:site-specific integrase [Bradyrhizobium sp. RP6]|uniref:site-specific integrase n=1 Tax=Bradyrhizobium sp. RP6 TaxID=2489596 RepID=UPI000F536DBC|nr:site-specific integrase [Bradyrhizobium sp. RP6]RQH12749.1 site-specific integrase [Bradyrhizobium sp. RP6]